MKKGGITNTDWEFYLTDGTTKIELNRGFFRIGESGWEPKIATYKRGGTFQSSPIADGRRMVDKRFNSVIERIPLVGVGRSFDGTTRAVQNLRRLLEQASDYWVTEWYDTPVYLVAQSPDETNTRYATITLGTMPDDPYFYGNPFRGRGRRGREYTWYNFDLILERGHWQSVAPGSETAVNLSAVESFNSINYGNVDSSGNREPVTTGVYVGNKYVPANITHIFRYDDSGASYSSNLQNTTPMDLMEPVPAVNDIVYFGVDSTVIASTAPFSSLIFNLTQAFVGSGYTGAWEYYNGASWTTLTVNDQTDSGTNEPFTRLGQNGVFWENPSDWDDKLTINTVSGYWVRMRITAMTLPLTIPIHEDRPIYAVNWPYTEIQSTEIGGDIPAIAKMVLTAASGKSTITDPIAPQRFFVGLKSRGNDGFVSCLNSTDVTALNSSGITCAAGSSGAFADSSLSQVGRRIEYTPGASTSNFTDLCKFTIDSTVSNDFRGRYLAFLRVGFSATVSTGDFDFRLVISQELGASFTTNSISPNISNPTGFPIHLVEFGEVKLPNGSIDYVASNSQINIQVESAPVSGASKEAYIYDLVLIPSDEMAIQSIDQNGTGTILDLGGTERRTVTIDSLTNPRIRIISYLSKNSGGGILGQWETINNGESILQSSKKQRLWFLFDIPYSVTPAGSNAQHENVVLLNVSSSNRYLSTRGDR